MSASPSLAKASPEAGLRAALGIPADAARVLVLSESSHWDTNWLQTSEEYFRARLEPIFAGIVRALEEDPARVYCIESVFFLKLYWERHPELQAKLRHLVERRQLRISTSSFTTPDTLLPHTEAVLRDFHLGQEWLHRVGLGVVPRTAYFPDNFGHSPHLPSLMQAVGVDAVAVTRIDGMYFIAADFRTKGEFPRKGSTAELLEKEWRTLDFVWRDDDGAEVLCHWNAFTYFQGDMLAHAGVIRWNGHVAAVPFRTRGHVARRIDGFVRQLEPVSRTPYLFCPIGMDFNDPIERVGELLERYNREDYTRTGTWVVLAGMDDYFALIGTRRASLPVLAVDPNPYWMGFYASRPELKQRPTRIARSLLLAERLSALRPPEAELEASLREGWENLVLMNHHDAITGTSPDRVSHAEQKDWLDAAEGAADRAVVLVSARVTSATPVVDVAPPPLVAWHGRELHVTTAHFRLTFSKERGGCLTSLVADGVEQLQGLGFDLVAHADDGGLWRLGHEYRGGRFDVVDRTSKRPARIRVLESGDALSVVVDATIAGKEFTRTITCRRNAPLLEVHTSGFAARRRTVSLRSELPHAPVTMSMDTLGGTITRPRERGHRPTYWPVPGRVTLHGAKGALHAGFEAPTAVSFGADHALEWIVARNPMRERAFGVLPVLAHPIGGTVDERQDHQAVVFATRDAAIAPSLRQSVDLAWLPIEERRLVAFADHLVEVDDPNVAVAAVKRADVGAGVVLRLVRGTPGEREVRVGVSPTFGQVWGAFRCNAREEDDEPLAIEAGRAVVALRSRLTSVRLVVR